MVVAREGECYDGEEDEVSSAGEVSEFVEFEGECYGEEEELVGDGYEEGGGEVVVVEGVDRCHGCCRFCSNDKLCVCSGV